MDCGYIGRLEVRGVGCLWKYSCWRRIVLVWVEDGGECWICNVGNWGIRSEGFC